MIDPSVISTWPAVFISKDELKTLQKLNMITMKKWWEGQQRLSNVYYVGYNASACVVYALAMEEFIEKRRILEVGMREVAARNQTLNDICATLGGETLSISRVCRFVPHTRDSFGDKRFSFILKGQRVTEGRYSIRDDGLLAHSHQSHRLYTWEELLRSATYETGGPLGQVCADVFLYPSQQPSEPSEPTPTDPSEPDFL